jgi:hypothetical protein
MTAGLRVDMGAANARDVQSQDDGCLLQERWIMRRMMPAMGVLLVLSWAAADTLGQGKETGKERGGDSAERGPGPERVEKGKVRPDAAKAEKDAGPPPADLDAGKGATGEKPADRHKGGKESPAAARQAAGKGGTPKGRGHEQQLLALQKQLQHEQAKHMERRARLTRIRELAMHKGDAEVVARVDKLMAKEQQVYERKLTHVQQQRRALSAGVEPEAKKKVETGAPDKKTDDGGKRLKEVDRRQGDAPRTSHPAEEAARESGRTKRQKARERAGGTADAADESNEQ